MTTMKKTTLITLALLSAALHAQVPVKGSTVDATQGYTVNGAAPNNFMLCGNGTSAVFAASCGTTAQPFYQTIQGNGASLPQRFVVNFDSNFTVSDTSPSTSVKLASTLNGVSITGNAGTATNANAVGGVPLSGLCQTGGAGCPTSGITGVTAGSGYIIFPTGMIMQWMPGPTVNEAGDSLHSGTWPIPFPHAIFGATCSTTTSQGGAGSPGDTDIHAMQMSSSTTSGWIVRHSVGGVYAQAQTVSCFLTAIGN